MYGTLKKAWFIEGYSAEVVAGILCRKCASVRSGVEGLRDPYTLEVVEGFTPIFASDYESSVERNWCEDCELLIGTNCAFPDLCDRCN